MTSFSVAICMKLHGCTSAEATPIRTPAFLHLASLLPWGWLEHLVETLASFTEQLSCPQRIFVYFQYLCANLKFNVYHCPCKLRLKISKHTNRISNLSIVCLLYICDCHLCILWIRMKFSNCPLVNPFIAVSMALENSSDSPLCRFIWRPNAVATTASRVKQLYTLWYNSIIL